MKLAGLESCPVAAAFFFSALGHTAHTQIHPTNAPEQTVIPCTQGNPVVTEGYTINYAWAGPTPHNGSRFEPSASWSSGHVVATQAFGGSTLRDDTNFAYIEFKCQYTCNAANGSSFYVEHGGPKSLEGTYCSCFDNLLHDEVYTPGNQTKAGAFNAICRDASLPVV
ncbi:hypothetical protein DL769_005939 [Monosporascus sp. CRB-8-3]|nr:hypothetical protein DL769_005939 [Monosporascus sp. CRB-8-3]